ncbi:SixA phosphatase family protein [Terrimonas pollutisoli]|uniref:SixA phosphatase family protein n=1 Tax=Terrimonas pollutisoli TaxID=3034147 RepID=UPI0023EAD2B5|nr:histidine phosphatase family protein [Terrimonas sp. H1YJ31]
MKTLILVRHAKSSWDDFSINDIDRPLNDRGKKDAPAMAKRLRDKDIKIDAFISSPAKRARKTAEAFAKEYKEEKQNIAFFDELYLASPSTFFDVISKTDDQFKTIAVFSHNDGITSFANMLTSTRIDNIPTSGVFAVKIKTKHWADFEKAEKEFWFFDSPKKGE